MKLALAALLLGAASIAGSAVPARAESSYWDNRSRGATSDDRGAERKRVVHRRYSDGRRVTRHRIVERDARGGDIVPKPFRVERNDGRAHPTMNNDYWQQSSNYDFLAGKAADVKSYRY